MKDASTQTAIILGDGTIEVVFDEIINTANNDDEINNDDEFNNYINNDNDTTFGMASAFGVGATPAIVTGLAAGSLVAGCQAVGAVGSLVGATVVLPLIGCVAGAGLAGGALGYGVYRGAKKLHETIATPKTIQKNFSSQFPELKMVCWHDVEKK
ncbi:unnamed protein product [Lasius platythorax]|uniref:Uncharacterized protein n=1 Tax=Lasius platythorax TaxID=488582 RepID=A0AAV2N5Y6_9HYME